MPFAGCDPCCGSNAEPCGNPPAIFGSNWWAEESEWNPGTGWNSGVVAGWTPQLTGWTQVTGSPQQFANDGVGPPCLDMGVEARITIDGIDGELDVLSYFLFDTPVPINSCERFLQELATCFHAKGSLRLWSGMDLDGESTRQVPPMYLVVRRAGVYYIQLISQSGNPFQQQAVSRSSWRRFEFRTGTIGASSQWQTFNTGATTNPLVGTIGPTLSGPNAQIEVGFGVLSRLFCYANPNSVSRRSAELFFKLDNFHESYLLGSAPGSQVCSNRSTSLRQSAVAYMAAGAGNKMSAGGADVEVAVATPSEWSCDAYQPLRLKYTFGQANSTVGIFLPGADFATWGAWNEWNYILTAQSCLEWRNITTNAISSGVAGNLRTYIHPAIRYGGNVYAGKFTASPNSTSAPVSLPTGERWSTASYGGSFYSGIVDVTSFQSPPQYVLDNVEKYGRGVDFGKIIGVSQNPQGLAGSWGYILRDMASPPPPVNNFPGTNSTAPVSNSPGPPPVGIEWGVYIVGHSDFASPTHWMTGIREHSPSHVKSIASACKMAKEIRIIIAGGVNAGTYVSSFVVPGDTGGPFDTRFPCFKGWVLGGTPPRNVFFNTEMFWYYGANFGVGIQTSPSTGDSWFGTVHYEWGAVTTTNLAKDPVSSSSSGATSVQVEIDMTW